MEIPKVGSNLGQRRKRFRGDLAVLVAFYLWRAIKREHMRMGDGSFVSQFQPLNKRVEFFWKFLNFSLDKTTTLLYYVINTVRSWVGIVGF
jgi:hypothetical protein